MLDSEFIIRPEDYLLVQYNPHTDNPNDVRTTVDFLNNKLGNRVIAIANNFVAEAMSKEDVIKILEEKLNELRGEVSND